MAATTGIDAHPVDGGVSCEGKCAGLSSTDLIPPTYPSTGHGSGAHTGSACLPPGTAKPRLKEMSKRQMCSLTAPAEAPKKTVKRKIIKRRRSITIPAVDQMHRAWRKRKRRRSHTKRAEGQTVASDWVDVHF